MIRSYLDRPVSRFDLQHLRQAFGDTGPGNWPPSGASHHAISEANILNGNCATIREHWFIDSDTDLVEPGSGGVVAASYVGAVGSLGVDLSAVWEQDHGPGAHLVPVLGFAAVQGAEDAGWPFHADGPGVGEGFGDDQPLGGCAAGVVGVLHGLVNDPFGAGSGLAVAASGQRQADEPVAGWGDLFGAGFPPPGASGDLVEDPVGLFLKPAVPLLFRESGNSVF
jgi:hypothetical protein